jgi:hypothetical protein
MYKLTTSNHRTVVNVQVTYHKSNARAGTSSAGASTSFEKKWRGGAGCRSELQKTPPEVWSGDARQRAGRGPIDSSDKWNKVGSVVATNEAAAARGELRQSVSMRCRAETCARSGTRSQQRRVGAAKQVAARSCEQRRPLDPNPSRDPCPAKTRTHSRV